MPNPIVPIHKQLENSALFDAVPNADALFGSSLSDIQSQLLGLPVREAATTRLSERELKILEAITEHEDDLISVAHALADTTGNKVSYYRVPDSISDSELLMLKTSGLIRGSGRSVVITEAGQIALRDQWLRSDNQLRATKAKSRFVHPLLEEKSKRSAVSQGKFERVADTVQRVKKVINPKD